MSFGADMLYDQDIDAYVEFVESRWSSHPGTRPNDDLRDLTIMGFGIGGECGEVQEKLKKYVRDDFLDRTALCKELGDVLFLLDKDLHAVRLPPFGGDRCEQRKAQRARGARHAAWEWR